MMDSDVQLWVYIMMAGKVIKKAIPKIEGNVKFLETEVKKKATLRRKDICGKKRSTEIY